MQQYWDIVLVCAKSILVAMLILITTMSKLCPLLLFVMRTSHDYSRKQQELQVMYHSPDTTCTIAQCDYMNAKVNVVSVVQKVWQ